MIGWDISVYRLTDGGQHPATEKSSKGIWIASWEAELEGTDWLENLVRQGKAFGQFHGGYPDSYTARAIDILPVLRSGPPEWRSYTSLQEFLATPPEYHYWKGGFAAAAADACRPDEWLLIEVWDES